MRRDGEVFNAAPCKGANRGLKSLSRLQVDVAQTAERFLRNEEVGGAIPLVGSMPVKHMLDVRTLGKREAVGANPIAGPKVCYGGRGIKAPHL